MSEQLTQSEINWIEGWIDALDADTYAAAILQKLVTAARGAQDAEQRAEQAEADAHEQRIHYDYLFDEAEKIRRQRDEARQEAAKLRQSLRTVVNDLAPTFNLTSEDLIAIRESAESTLQSAPPAIEPEQCPDCRGRGIISDGEGWQICHRCRDADPADAPASEPTNDWGREDSDDMYTKREAPADRPEPSEALPKDWRGMDAVDRLIFLATINGTDETCKKAMDAEVEIRQSLSQPAPAVPDAVRQLPEYWRLVARNLRSINRDPHIQQLDAATAEGYESSANDLESALATRPAGGDSPAVPDYSWAKLPCDVTLPPATTISAGCKLSTLIHALEVRGLAAAPTPTDGGE